MADKIPREKEGDDYTRKMADKRQKFVEREPVFLLIKSIDTPSIQQSSKAT